MNMQAETVLQRLSENYHRDDADMHRALMAIKNQLQSILNIISRQSKVEKETAHER